VEGIFNNSTKRGDYKKKKEAYYNGANWSLEKIREVRGRGNSVSGSIISACDRTEERKICLAEPMSEKKKRESRSEAPREKGNVGREGGRVKTGKRSAARRSGV